MIYGSLPMEIRVMSSNHPFGYVSFLKLEEHNYNDAFQANKLLVLRCENQMEEYGLGLDAI